MTAPDPDDPRPYLAYAVAVAAYVIWGLLFWYVAR